MRSLSCLVFFTVFLTACSQPVAEDTDLPPDAEASSASSVASSQASSIAGPQTFHEVSLPALMQKEFDGRDLKLGQVQSRTDTYTRYTITYKSGDLTISGILNIPHGDGPFPVLMLNHGFIEPSIYTNGRGLKREQDYFARNGFAVLHSDYRNHAFSDKDPESDARIRLGYVEDVINAIHAVRNSGIPQLDGERIGMLGHSMGGGVTLNILVTKPDLVEAAVLYAAVSGDATRNYERWLKRRAETAARIDELYGNPEKNPQFWHDVSAESYLENIEAPVLIFHGDADKDVPVEWSRELNEDLKALGKEVTYTEFAREGHEYGPQWGAFMQQSAEFFRAHLR